MDIYNKILLNTRIIDGHLAIVDCQNKCELFVVLDTGSVKFTSVWSSFTLNLVKHVSNKSQEIRLPIFVFFLLFFLFFISEGEGFAFLGNTDIYNNSIYDT